MYEMHSHVALKLSVYPFLRIEFTNGSSFMSVSRGDRVERSGCTVSC